MLEFNTISNSYVEKSEYFGSVAGTYTKMIMLSNISTDINYHLFVTAEPS